jgi:hypothetical protein
MNGDELAVMLAKAVLVDLSDRAGLPEWIGSQSDRDARELTRDIAIDVILPLLREHAPIPEAKEEKR